MCVILKTWSSQIILPYCWVLASLMLPLHSNLVDHFCPVYMYLKVLFLVVVSMMLWLQTVGCEKVSAQSIPSFLLCMSLVFIDQKKNGYIFLGAMTLLCIYSTTSTAWLLVVLVFSLTDSIDNVNLLSSSMKCSLNDFCNALFNNTFYKSYVASFPCYY